MAVVHPVVDHHVAEPGLHDVEGIAVGALIMLGTLFGLIVLIFALVLRYDPEARCPSKSRGAKNV
jgi:hypothetical protein